MERSFKKEVQALKLGDGETFHGEGILAVTKALLQSGVSYVGGYQGAPVSHLLDVLVDAGRALFARWNVHPTFPDNLGLVASVDSKRVMPAFGDPKYLPLWRARLAPRELVASSTMSL